MASALELSESWASFIYLFRRSWNHHWIQQSNSLYFPIPVSCRALCVQCSIMNTSSHLSASACVRLLAEKQKVKKEGISKAYKSSHLKNKKTTGWLGQKNVYRNFTHIHTPAWRCTRLVIYSDWQRWIVKRKQTALIHSLSGLRTSTWKTKADEKKKGIWIQKLTRNWPEAFNYCEYGKFMVHMGFGKVIKDWKKWESRLDFFKVEN